MAILLLLIAFGSIFHLCNLVSALNWRVNLLKTVLVFSTIVLVITEGLSVINSLNYQNIVYIWLGVITIVIGLIFWKKNNKKNIIFPKIETYTVLEKRLIYCLSAFIGLILLQGILYPPNNWDSMSYHLVRIVHWISNESVAHFRAQDYRQIHQAPFAEFFIMQINLLVGSDFLANTLQLVFLIFIALCGSLLGKELGLNRKYQIITTFLILTIPQVVIQASSTKNDLIVCFFIIAACYFMLLYTKNKTFSNFLFIGLATGLSMLTKTTSYLFLFPILCCFGFWFIRDLIIERNWKPLVNAALISMIVISINAGYFYRNYELDKNIFGVTTTTDNGYSNTKIGVSTLFSNVTRNISLHIAPFPLSLGSEWSARKLHELFDINIDNPQTTFGFTKYKVTNYPNGEGDSPNFIHLLLATIALTYVFKRVGRKNILSLLLASIVLSQFILFCLYLKWQPWHTRLHIPLFILSCPLIAYYLQSKSKKRMEPYLFLAIGTYALAIILFNGVRPFITVSNVTSNISVVDDRHKKTFVALPHLENNYKRIKNIVKEQNFKEVVFLEGIDMEYALVNDLSQAKVKLYNKEVNNKSERIGHNIPMTPQSIISRSNQQKIKFQGIDYYNLNPNSKYLFVYGTSVSNKLSQQ